MPDTSMGGVVLKLCVIAPIKGTFISKSVQILFVSFLGSMNFEIDPQGLPRTPSGPKGSRGDPKCIFLILKTY